MAEKESQIDSKVYLPFIFGALGLIILTMVFGTLAILSGVIILGQVKNKREKKWCYAGIGLGVLELILWGIYASFVLSV